MQQGTLSEEKKGDCSVTNKGNKKNTDRTAFFHKISKEAEVLLDKSRPFMIFLDGANITSNRAVSLLDESVKSYSWSIAEVCCQMTKKYEDCLFMYAVSDEVNICVTDPERFAQHFNSKHAVYATELRDMILQEFFLGMYSAYGHAVYFHCWYMSLYEDNLYSYLIWRKHRGVNALVYNFIKQNAGTGFKRNCEGKKLEEVEERCRNAFPDYKDRTIWQKRGLAFFCGQKYDIEKFLNSHKFDSTSRVKGKDVKEEYRENCTEAQPGRRKEEGQQDGTGMEDGELLLLE